jgi:hypothetical protein
VAAPQDEVINPIPDDAAQAGLAIGILKPTESVS